MAARNTTIFPLSLHDALPISKMGSLQLYDSASQSLALAAQSGFKSSVLEHFGIITSHMISCCGDALTHGKPDRKSTRLNSSHRTISYAVFCLKKKIVTTIYKN